MRGIHPPIVLLLLLTLVASASAQKRGVVALDGTWKLAVDPEKRGDSGKWYAQDVDRSGWSDVRVPGSWDDAGHADFDGIGWYATTFTAAPVKGMRQAVVFDAVDDNAEVWINGQLVGRHTGYGQKFHFDITRLVKKKGVNCIVVRIEDLAGPGGITGSVRIQPFRKETELLKSPYHDMTPVASPQWVKDAVVYEVYLRSFSPEGTFKGLEAKLADLKTLGVTVLWLMPIHPVGVLHRKGTLGSPYSVKDFRAVNPEFGTMDDFRSLVTAVHREGMHIIIDLVANHTSWDNPLITSHPEWYMKNPAGEIVAPNPDWTDVADLDYRQRGLWDWMKETMLWWVRDVGIDGFRCDVAEMVPTEFWREARAALDAVKPVMMIAEGTLPEEHIGAFDLTYAWNTYDILEPIISGRLAPSALDAVLTTEYHQFPKNALRLRFSSNHDKNMYDAPAITRLGADGAAAAAALMYTLPGVPLIYNGDEVGNPVRLSLFEKVPIAWTPDTAKFRRLYQTLNHVRSTVPALRYGTMTRIKARRDDDPGICAFTRDYKGERIFVVFNLSRRSVEYTLDISTIGGFQLRLARCGMRIGQGTLGLSLPPFGYWVGSGTTK